MCAQWICTQQWPRHVQSTFIALKCENKGTESLSYEGFFFGIEFMCKNINNSNVPKLYRLKYAHTRTHTHRGMLAMEIRTESSDSLTCTCFLMELVYLSISLPG